MKIILKNGTLVNEGVISQQDILINDGLIDKIERDISHPHAEIHDCAGKWVIPGIIDDQVHFREPGLIHKGDIESESKAAVAGGVTSYMEMPNTLPATLTQDLLQSKYDIAARKSWCNYSFYMGLSNDNLEEVLKTDPNEVCGIKIFMGSSTGNMLVDDEEVLKKVFLESNMLIATHCEDETTVRRNNARFMDEYGADSGHARLHPLIRDVEACYLSSSMAVDLAKMTGARLHILHISTEKELDLFDNTIPLAEKRITAEVCVHHLYFNSDDYEILGNRIKCNPAIKERFHQESLFKALLDNRLDIIATDHAPHAADEKSQGYFKAPAGLPLVQHGLNIMLDFYDSGMISLERIVEKMCHAPAICFKIKNRGFLREGYFADIAVVNPTCNWTVESSNIYYKCGWSPLEGRGFSSKVESTYVNGHRVYYLGKFLAPGFGRRLQFHD